MKLISGARWFGQPISSRDDAVAAAPTFHNLSIGGTVISCSPGDFGKLIADETEKWAKVVKVAGIKPD